MKTNYFCNFYNRYKCICDTDFLYNRYCPALYIYIVSIIFKYNIGKIYTFKVYNLKIITFTLLFHPNNYLVNHNLCSIYYILKNID